MTFPRLILQLPEKETKALRSGRTAPQHTFRPWQSGDLIGSGWPQATCSQALPPREAVHMHHLGSSQSFFIHSAAPQNFARVPAARCPPLIQALYYPKPGIHIPPASQPTALRKGSLPRGLSQFLYKLPSAHLCCSQSSHVLLQLQVFAYVLPIPKDVLAHFCPLL